MFFSIGHTPNGDKRYVICIADMSDTGSFHVNRQGSKFIVSIPVGPVSGGGGRKLRPAEVCVPAVRGGVKALLIDDDPLQLEMTAAMCRQAGVGAECCQYPEYAAKLVADGGFDVVLTDIQMPGADGFSVLELLRGSDIPQAKEIPIIAVTAHSGNKEKYLSEGFAGCLYKPFSEEDLLAAVSQMDRLDITAIMEGEEYVEEMLDIFIEDTTEELSGMRDAFSMRNYVKLGSIIHKAAPLWEMIRINIPRSELKGMASMPPEKWGGISDERIEKLIEAVEQAVEKAKKIKEKTYGNRIGSGR